MQFYVIIALFNQLEFKIMKKLIIISALAFSGYALADNIALISNDPIASFHFKDDKTTNISHNTEQYISDLDKQSKLSITERNRIVNIAKSMLKTKYVYGGKSKTGVDCSGLVSYVFNKIGLPLNGTARDIAKQGTKINREKAINGNLMAGDLLFFNTTGKPNSHVGIVINKDTFIHASTGQRKVVIARLNSSYFKNKLEFAKRF